MKKLLCILLAIMCLCLVGCNDTPTVETPPCEHNYILLKSTTDCETAGVEIWICSKCNEYKNIEINNPSHKYKNNICSICGKFEKTNLSELSQENKNYLYNELKKKSPTLYTYDNIIQIKEELTPIKEERSRLLGIINMYDKSVFNVEQDIADKAKEDLIPVEEEYQEIYQKLNEKCKGYAWLLLFSKFEENNISNYSINNCITKAKTLFSEIWGNLPNQDFISIINDIKTIIGIDITK